MREGESVGYFNVKQTGRRASIKPHHSLQNWSVVDSNGDIALDLSCLGPREPYHLDLS